MSEQRPPDWLSTEKIDLMRRTLCPAGISDGDFELFVETCRRSGLNPFAKEAFCVPRRQNKGSREKPQWVTFHECQPSETGMLTRAERFPDYVGTQTSAVYAEDEILIDAGAGTVAHRFNPAKRKGSLVGAWARTVREGKLPVVVWLEFSGYVQTTPLWAKIPGTMIEKCARVAALRKAYPEAFGGLYVREELPPEEHGEGAPGRPSTSGVREEGAASGREAGGGDNGEESSAEGYGGSSAPGMSARTSRPALESSVMSAPAERPVETNAPAASQATGEPSVVVAFGTHRGKPTSELSDEDLVETIDMAHEKLMEQPKAKWADAMRRNLTLLEQEATLRARVPPAAKPPPAALVPPPSVLASNEGGRVLSTAVRKVRRVPAAREPGEEG